MPNGPMKITGLTFDESLYESENTVVDEEIKVTTVSSDVFQLIMSVSLFHSIPHRFSARIQPP